MDLGPDKFRGLIQHVSTEKPSFAIQLKYRLKLVKVFNDGDCIRIIPREWINKKTWREINDILKLNAFGWISNDKEGYWLKLNL